MTMERLQQLVAAFYTTGQSSARSQLESEIAAIKVQQDAVDLVLDGAIAPYFFQGRRCKTETVHPQLVFLCLGILQERIRKWHHLRHDSGLKVIDILTRSLHAAHEETKIPSYLSSKVIQLLGEIALFEWPDSKFDPLALGMSMVRNSLAGGRNGQDQNTLIALNLGLKLVQATCQAFSSTQTCSFLPSARAKVIESRWADVARLFENDMTGVFRPLLEAITDVRREDRVHVSAASPYPSPISPAGQSLTSSGRQFRESDDGFKDAVDACLGILQTLPHPLRLDSLEIIRFLGQQSSPCWDAAVDVLHAQLSKAFVEPTTFPSLVEVAIEVLKDSLPSSASNSLGDEDNQRDRAMKALRDIASPLTSFHLARLPTPRVYEIVHVVANDMALSGPALHALQATVDHVMTVPDPEPWRPVMEIIIGNTMRFLNHIPKSDLDVEQVDGVHDSDALDKAGFMNGMAVVAETTTLTSTLNLLTTISEIDSMLVFSAIFPTLNECVSHFLGGGSLTEEFVFAFSISLRITARILPAMDCAGEVLPVVLDKMLELLQSSISRSEVPGMRRISMEVIVCLQALIPYMAHLSKNGNSQNASRLVEICASVLQSPFTEEVRGLQMLASRLLYSIASTVRPSLEREICDVTYEILAPLLQGQPWESLTMKLVETMVAGIVFMTAISANQPMDTIARANAVQSRVGPLCRFFELCRQTQGPRVLLSVANSAFTTVESDTNISKAIVANALEASHLQEIVHGFRECNDAHEIQLYLTLFSGYVGIQRRSEAAKALVPMILQHSYRKYGPTSKLYYGLLAALADDPQVFGEHISFFSELLANDHFLVCPGLVQAVERIFMTHGKAFFPSSLVANGVALDERSFNVLVGFVLSALNGTDLELARSSVLTLKAVHSRWRLFSRDVWKTHIFRDAVVSVVNASLRGELKLLLEDFASLLKDIIVACDFNSVSGPTLKFAFSSMFSQTTGLNRAVWEGVVVPSVSTLQDSASFELNYKRLVHDVQCLLQ